MIPETINTLQDMQTLVFFNAMAFVSIVTSICAFMFGVFLLRKKMWIFYVFNLGAQILGVATAFFIWGASIQFGIAGTVLIIAAMIYFQWKERRLPMAS